MDDAKQQLADKLKSANNVLVTVSRNPSVDQLSALLGLTLVLNKQGKHAAAVYSGSTPSTIEFLQPEATIEKNTDSLRDFIIALDKNKADKLRYKVEDDVVRIFITPYKTSISSEDFDFSQGDFNVDVVVALGVRQQEDLDEAITAHGRILHDATVASINVTADGGLGTISWHADQSSSLSELVTELIQQLGPNLLDEQIATALLTGIVSETDRFRNEKTSSGTMSASAVLMSAGANQQLVASKLEEPLVEPEQPNDNKGSDGAQEVGAEDELSISDDGTIEIQHGPDEDKSTDDKSNEAPLDLPTPDPDAPQVDEPEMSSDSALPDSGLGLSSGSKLVTEPPTLGGTLTANSSEQKLDPVTDPFSMPASEAPMLNHPVDTSAPATEPTVVTPAPEPAPTPEPPAPEPAPEPPKPAPKPAEPAPLITGLTPPPPAWVPPSEDPLDLNSIPGLTTSPTDNSPTLEELEKSVGSPHLEPAGLDAARDEVDRALNNSAAAPPPQAPIQALNSQPLGDDLHPSDVTPSDATTPGTTVSPTDDSATDSSSPPPVPPPIPFQFNNPPNPS